MDKRKEEMQHLLTVGEDRHYWCPRKCLILGRCWKSEHVPSPVWAVRSLEKHLQPSPSPNVASLSWLDFHSEQFMKPRLWLAWGRPPLAGNMKLQVARWEQYICTGGHYSVSSWNKRCSEWVCFAAVIHLLDSLTLLLAAFERINKPMSTRKWALNLLYQSHQNPAQSTH